MKIYMLCLKMVGTKGRLYLIWRLEGPDRMENIYMEEFIMYMKNIFNTMCVKVCHFENS